MHRPVLVTEDEAYRSRIQLSANVFALSTTPSLVIGGKPLKMERDCSMRVKFVEEGLTIPVLLDTGAAPQCDHCRTMGQTWIPHVEHE